MLKREFMDKVRQTNENTKYLVQGIQLANGDKEVQVTQYSKEKVDYIVDTYDYEMRHNRNLNIRILDVMLL